MQTLMKCGVLLCFIRDFHSLQMYSFRGFLDSVNSEIFVSISFSRIPPKYTLRRKKSRLGYKLPVSVNDRVIQPLRECLIFTKLHICELSRKLNSCENFGIYSTKG